MCSSLHPFTARLRRGRENKIDAEEIIPQTLLVLTLGDIQLTFQPASRLGGRKKGVARAVDGEAVLGKIRGFELSSWNFIEHDPKEFRHYGPMAQDFFAAFGHDGIGQIGSETTINSGDLAGILMIAVQALEKRTAELKQKEAQIAVLASKVEELTAKYAYLETVAARLEGVTIPPECAGADGQSDQVITRVTGDRSRSLIRYFPKPLTPLCFAAPASPIPGEDSAPL